MLIFLLIARDTSSVHGQAFDRCVGKMSVELEPLGDFKDDGTEAEVRINKRLKN